MNVMLSVVVVTYNRAQLLAATLASARGAVSSLPAECGVEFIVADDCSDEPHRSIVASLDDVRVVSTSVNSGLGTNVNNALQVAQGRFVLQLQDDWEWDYESLSLGECLEFMEENPDVGVLQLTETSGDVGSEVRFFRGVEYRVFRNDHAPWIRDCRVRPYSDQPHLKRRAFIEEVGPYREGCGMCECENEFKMRVANQERWRVACTQGAAGWRHTGALHSMNPGDRASRVAMVLSRLPGGSRYLVPTLRRMASAFDHAAASVLARTR